MQFQFDVASCSSPSTPAPATPEAGSPVVDLLRQILEVERQHLAQAQATAAAHDAGARWRALLARWRQDFPGLPENCRQILPVLERAYGAILNGMVEEIRQHGDEALDNDFSLQDFLDRYGMRLGQMGNILNLVVPLAEASTQNETNTP